MRGSSWDARVVVERAQDDEGFYYSVANADFAGPFMTAEDRDRELGSEIARLRRSIEERGARLRPASGGSWVIEVAHESQAA